MNQSIRTASKREPRNKGKLVGQKAPLGLKDIWAIRIRLQLGERIQPTARRAALQRKLCNRRSSMLTVYPNMPEENRDRCNSRDTEHREACES